MSCITERAAEFQGFENSTNIESLQAVRYEEGGKYDFHYDWEATPADGIASRKTSFLVILEADCTNCGTQFPYLKYEWAYEDERICHFVECGEDSMIVKPKVGSGIFWSNVYGNGTGNNFTLHAGLPIKGRKKVALNIWTKFPPIAYTG